MFKYFTFKGTAPDGSPLVQALIVNGELVKTASGGMHPAVQRFARSITPKGGKLYVLVNALGAGEYYGANINGDYFEEDELVNIADGRGHKSFLDAGVYRHHVNKDPEKSMGAVLVSEYNAKMHRVELIVEIDREKAAELGHADLVEKLDRGENPAVSMGCKVPYDVCSICGHKSKTRADYCEHTRRSMGKLLDDGRKVFVYNPRPRFFDISFVLVGADKASYAMSKLASDPSNLVKTAAPLTKRATKQKLSDIVKRLPAMASRVLNPITRAEPEVSKKIIIRLSSQPIDRVLTSAASRGILFSPAEFQRLILHKAGRQGLAERLHSSRRVFRPVDRVRRDFPMGPSKVDGGLASLLSSLVGARSFLGPSLERRAVIIKLGSPAAAPVEENYLQNDLLDGISAMYNGYRIDLLEKIGSLITKTAAADPGYRRGLQEHLLEDEFMYGTVEKRASMGLSQALALLSVPAFAYIYGAHKKAENRAGKQIGPLDAFVAEHPAFATGVLLGLARLGHRAHKTGQLSKLLDKVVDKI